MTHFRCVYNNNDEVEKPLCIICGKILSAETMKLSKLKKHFIS